MPSIKVDEKKNTGAMQRVASDDVQPNGLVC